MHRHRRPVILIWLTFFLASVSFLLKVEEPLKVGGFSSDRTEAARARMVIERELGAGGSQLVVIFKTDDQPVANEDAQERISAALAPFEGAPHVLDIVLPSDNAAHISGDGKSAYALVSLDLPAAAGQNASRAA